MLYSYIGKLSDCERKVTINISIIYDNNASKGYITGHGFSAIIEKDAKVIIFDAGWNGFALMKNLEAATFDPKRIHYVVLSHKHWDHIGGLDTLLQYTKHPTVFVPTTFSSTLKSEITKFAELREVTKDKGVEIFPGVITSPAMKADKVSLYEMSLFVKTESGIVVITGCSHQGLDKIIDEAAKLGKVHAIIGGFHGFDKLKKLKDINLIVPCHCTKLKEEIMMLYPEKTKRCFSGLKLTIK